MKFSEILDDEIDNFIRYKYEEDLYYSAYDKEYIKEKMAKAILDYLIVKTEK